MEGQGVVSPGVVEFVAAIGAERDFEIYFFCSVGEGAGLIAEFGGED